MLKAGNALLVRPLLSEDGFAVEEEQRGYDRHFDAPPMELNPAITAFQNLTIRKWDEHLASLSSRSKGAKGGRNVRPPRPRARDERRRPPQRRDIGGGPVGSLAALAFAAQGARVVVLEANPRAATRLAGEWLHPPAVELLARLGVDLSPEAYPTGRGFVVLPDDGSAPIVLSYAEGRRGASLHHERLVAKLRRSIIANDAIEYIEGARATEIGDGGIRYRLASGPEKVVEAKQVVGACGALRCGAPCALGFKRRRARIRAWLACCTRNVTLPHEGYGHLCLGAPDRDPRLYRVSPREVRACLDVPHTLDIRGDRAAALYEAYAPALPAGLRTAFERALLAGDIAWAANQTRLRRTFGRPGFALVGDAWAISTR